MRYLKTFEDIDYFPGKTSLKQISMGLKILVSEVEKGNIYSKVNLDYGGGKYDLGTEFLEEHGIENLVYDTFNRSDSHNKYVLDKVKSIGGTDTVTMLNVLNVIREEETRIYCIKHSYSLLKSGGVLLITIYKGVNEQPGMSRQLTWQENRKTVTYIDEIKKSLGENINIELKRDGFREYLIVRKPLNEGFQLKTEKGSVIKRSKYGVGKDIGDCIYIHKKYWNMVLDKNVYEHFLNIFKNSKYSNLEFNLLKIKKDFSSITFLYSKDFDYSDEPELTYGIKCDTDGRINYFKSDNENPPIYHHKWLFVVDDYPNFDVEESKQRSKKWLSIPNIDFSRIGYKKFWKENINI